MRQPREINHEYRGTILFISQFLWTMGENCGMPTVFRTVKGFVEAGFKCFLILPANAPDTPCYVLYRGISIFNISMRLWPLQPRCNYLRWETEVSHSKVIGALLWRLSVLLFWLKATIVGIQLSRKLRPVLVYGMTPMGIIPAFLIAKALRIPNVSRLFGLKTMFRERNPLSLLARHHLSLLALKTPTELLIITRDGSWSRTTEMALGVPRSRLNVWFNGIEETLFARLTGGNYVRRRLGVRQSDVLLGMLTQLVRYRGVESAIRALAIARRKIKSVKLMLVGSGEDEKYFRELTNQLDVSETVLFVGNVNRANIPHYLAAIDISLALAPASNLSNFVLESMVAGKCVVAFDTCDVREAIEHEGNGILVPPGDLQQLSQCIVHLSRDRILRERLGRKAAEWAAKNLLPWKVRLMKEVETVEELVLRRHL